MEREGTSTGSETTFYTYDVWNQLVKTTVGDKTITYAYNGEGYRVRKTVNGETTQYLYEYDKVVLETDGAGNQTGRNIYGTNLLARTADSDTYYYMYNGHADVTALLNASTGDIMGTYYYDAFGNITEQTGSVNNSITYAGYQYDEETKNYYLNARYYDPKVARFLSEDTYTGDPNDPLSLNLYTYCQNEPIMYWDPMGHDKTVINESIGFITTIPDDYFDTWSKNGWSIFDGNVSSGSNLSIINTFSETHIDTINIGPGNENVNIYNQASIGTIYVGAWSKSKIGNSGYIGNITTYYKSTTAISNGGFIGIVSTGVESNAYFYNDNYISAIETGKSSSTYLNNLRTIDLLVKGGNSAYGSPYGNNYFGGINAVIDSGDFIGASFNGIKTGVKNFTNLEGLADASIMFYNPSPMEMAFSPETTNMILEKKREFAQTMVNNLHAQLDAAIAGGGEVKLYYVSKVGTEAVLTYAVQKGGSYIVNRVSLKFANATPTEIARIKETLNTAQKLSRESVVDKLDRYLLNPEHPVGAFL